jgi:nucleotide-binding universal stress UspA family protein
MTGILVPVGASFDVSGGVGRAIERYRAEGSGEVHLLHVRLPFSYHVARFIRSDIRAAYHRAAAERALRPARALLDRAGVPCVAHVAFGDVAAAVASHAQRLGCRQIVMGLPGGAWGVDAAGDLTVRRIVELASVPVEIVRGPARSRVARYGMPAGVGAMLWLLMEAAEAS